MPKRFDGDKKGLGLYQTDNSRNLAEKVDLRKRVLAELNGAGSRVFDAFCGAGKMYDFVWKNADAYSGCDIKPWTVVERPRYSCDNRRLMRSIDLRRFNVFDFDAYGSPWDQMEILARRRKWAPGERGAVVMTDASMVRLRYGDMVPGSIQRMVGMNFTVPATSPLQYLYRTVLGKWAALSNVKILRQWEATGGSKRLGKAGVLYVAAVFEGLS